MGRGRKALPKNTLRLAGTFRADQSGVSIDPSEGVAECPPWLSENAREHWPEVSALLDRMGLMSPDYTMGIALFCDALADWIEASQESAAAPKVSETTNGNRVQDPTVGIKNKAFERVMKMVIQFGMTPSAMRGVAPKAGGAVDPLAAFAKSKSG